MAYTIVIASRYLIPLFLYLFLSCSIYALFVGDVRKQSGAAALQMVFLFLMQFTAWLTIVIRTQQSKYLLFYAFLQILTLALPVLAWFIYPGISRIVMNHMCMLFSAGLIVLTRLDLTKAIKQLIIAGASFVVFLIVPWILRKCRFLEKLGWIYAGIGISALGIVLILGQVTHGSKLSWSIGGITFQPSEFVKLTFVFFLAAVLSEKTGIRQVVAAGIGATAHVLILVLSKDLGSALILFMVYVFLMTISAHQPLYLAGGLVAGAGASLLAYRMFSHVQVRVQAWRDPWSVIDKQGYQIAQALFAMSRGGLFGLGIGKGTPQDIPYVETDFIFSAVIEELGLLFGIGILLTAAVLFVLMIRLAGGLADGFYRNLVVGFAILFELKSKEERKKDKQKKQNKWQMNRELYLCSLLMLAVFAGMIWYLADYVSSNQEALFNNSYNSQQRVLAQENTRGTIYAGTGEVLAQTVIAEDGTSVREYPYKNIFAHVVGYTDKGKTGIEELENYQLIHSDISDREKLDHELAGEKNPGNDVYTTLDTSLQQAASDALGLYRGAIVVTEVKTGRVLAMVSKPDYDPNKIAENWETLSTDKDKAALVNRGTQGLYPPGSTFKIVTALAYIRQNPDSWQNYHYQCNGAYINGDNKINCYHGSVHGDVNLMTSFAKSCNASFANIGMSMDREKFGETIDGLLFNQEFSFPLPYNQTKVTLDQDSTDEDVIQTSIGQGKTQITPVQLNLITAAIANGGKLMQPIVVDRVLNADGKILEKNEPSVYRELMSEKESEVMISLMEDVVQEGTGRKLKDRSYTAAGKTGSAEFSSDKSESHAWFTGFAPTENPEIAVTVIVESAGSGSDYAVPLARQVFDAYFSD